MVFDAVRTKSGKPSRAWKQQDGRLALEGTVVAIRDLGEGVGAEVDIRPTDGQIETLILSDAQMEQFCSVMKASQS